MRHDIPGDEDLGRQIGAIVRSTREESGWSQREFAARLGTSQSVVQRLENGSSRYVDTRLATKALRVLGVRSMFEARTLGLAHRREQRDLVHARCVSFAARRLRRLGWDVVMEVEVGSGRYRGWIDLLAYRAIDRALLCVEIKTEIDDVGRIQRTVGWYGREAPTAALRLGWRPRTTSLALLMLCSTDNDHAVRANLGLLRATFPSPARALAAWTSVPGPLAPAGTLAMIDPWSRRRDWLRPTASEGRRTQAPYSGYADAAVALRGWPAGRPT